jgi:hypothetical protein
VAPHPRTHFELPSRFVRLFGDFFETLVWAVALISGGLSFLYFANALEGMGLVSLGALMLFLGLRRTRVTAGADGIEIRWLWSSFIPYSAVGGIERHAKYKTQLGSSHVETSRGVLLEHGDGSTYLICDDPDARDLIHAVQQGWNKHRRAAAAADLAVIRRGDRSMADWMTSLRRLLDQPGGYRGRATTPDELWAILENPKTDACDRAAAALALRSHLGEEARPRLRVAIDECASPHLRVALEAIEENSDEATTTESISRLGPSDS